MKVKEAVKFLNEKVDPDAELLVFDGMSTKSVQEIFDNELSTVKFDRAKLDRDYVTALREVNPFTPKQ